MISTGKIFCLNIADLTTVLSGKLINGSQCGGKIRGIYGIFPLAGMGADQQMLQQFKYG